MNKVKPTKLSTEAMSHVKKLGLLRSDLLDDVTNEQVLSITDQAAKWILIGRWACEGNLEQLAPVAKQVISRYGGGQSEIEFLQGYVDKAVSDPDWRYWATEHIWHFLEYARLYLLKQAELPDWKRLLKTGIKGVCKDIPRIEMELKIGIKIDAERRLRELLCKVLPETQEKIKQLRRRMKAHRGLGYSELMDLEKAKKDERYLLDKKQKRQMALERLPEI